MNADEFAGLIERAQEAAAMAYAPYSSFPVGAAILTDSGEIVTGCNVENASYGLSICAERVAAFKAVSAGLGDFKAIAIYTPTPELTRPCGACRQVLAEFSPDMVVVMSGDGGPSEVLMLSELLPMPFTK